MFSMEEEYLVFAVCVEIGYFLLVLLDPIFDVL